MNKLFRWLSIKSKLIIAFVGLSIFPIIVLGAYGIISTIKSMKHSVVQDLDHDLTLIQENTANLLNDIAQDLQLIQPKLFNRKIKTSIR